MWKRVGAALLSLSASLAGAADYAASAEDYRDLLSHLQPGDRLRLAPGDYLRGLPLHNLAGLPGKPIIIEAQDPATPPRFLARPGANTVSLVNVRHLTLRHLILDGRNQPVDAVKAEGHSRFADFVTLEHLHIHDHAASQQNVGISTKCPAFGWVVRGNRIERVGTGMYFGDSDGSDPFVAGTIEANRIAETLGYNLQIKHQRSRPIDHAGRHDTLIRYNLFSKAGAQPNPLARPNLLLGHFPRQGAGSEDRYLVYGNVFLHNPSEALLQAEGTLAIYDNLFVNPTGDAIRIQPHNDVPRDMMIFSNTIVASGTGISVRQREGEPYRQRLIGNVVSATTPISGGDAEYNVVLEYRADWADRDMEALLDRASSIASAAKPLPASVLREFARFPDWRWRSHSGADLEQRTLLKDEGR